MEKTHPSNAMLMSSDVLPFSAGLVYFLTDPTAACQAAAAGHWVPQARSLQTRFLEGNPAGGPTQEKVSELMGAIQKNVKGSERQEVRARQYHMLGTPLNCCCECFSAKTEKQDSACMHENTEE